MGADNQQERLIGWITGFVDGEGCFSIGFVRQPGRPGRTGYRTGYQVTHEFVVTQGAKSTSALIQLRDFFGVGQVIINTRYDDHREHLHRYDVRRRDDLVGVIIPFFRQSPLRISKAFDFEQFARCVEMMTTARHRTPQGVAELLEIAQTMNRRKSRDAMIRILRGHTPDGGDSR
jgi:hypothetical protein